MFIRRSKKKNLFVIILLIFTICIILTGCRKDKKGELVLVTEAGFAPYEYYSNGKIVGVDIDIARKIADYLDKEATCLVTITDSPFEKDKDYTALERQFNLNNMIVLALESIIK